jgi:hypothetical protein
MSFVADDLGAWLVYLLADAGRKKLTALILGTEQERALRQAATAAVRVTAGDLRPEGGARAQELAIVVNHVFGEPVPDASSRVQECPAASDQLRCFRLRCRPQNIPVAASCAPLKEVHHVAITVPECDALLPHRSTPTGQTIAFNDPRRSVSGSRLALSAA